MAKRKLKRVLVIAPLDETPQYYLLTQGEIDRANRDYSDIWAFIVDKEKIDDAYDSFKELSEAVAERFEIVEEYCTITY